MIKPNGNMWHWLEDEDDLSYERHARRRSVAITFAYFWDNFQWAVYKRIIRSDEPAMFYKAENKIAQKIQGVLNL